jgi:hypothetical protein
MLINVNYGFDFNSHKILPQACDLDSFLDVDDLPLVCYYMSICILKY